MGLTQFNGASASYSNATGTVIFSGLGITSFDFQGGDRAEIDVTTSLDTTRVSRAGRRSVRRLSLGVLFEDPTLAELEAMTAECGSGLLSIAAPIDCSVAAQVLSLGAFLMGYSITAQQDGVWEVNLEFMVDETAEEEADGG